jgi:hypothetical protein
MFNSISVFFTADGFVGTVDEEESQEIEDNG